MRICYIADLTSNRPIEFTSSLAKFPGVEYLGIYYRVSADIKAKLDFNFMDLESSRLGNNKTYISKRVIYEVIQFNPDLVVIEGYTIPANQILTISLRMKKIPWVSWTERPGMRRGYIRSVLRRAINVANYPLFVGNFCCW